MSQDEKLTSPSATRTMQQALDHIARLAKIIAATPPDAFKNWAMGEKEPYEVAKRAEAFLYASPSSIATGLDDMDRRLMAALVTLRHSLERDVIPGDVTLTLLSAEGLLDEIGRAREIAERQMNDAEQARIELAECHAEYAQDMATATAAIKEQTEAADASSKLVDDLQRRLSATACTSGRWSDAERYRYLQKRSCGNATGGKGSDEECFLSLNPRDMDAAIDSHLDDEARRGVTVDSRHETGEANG